MNTLSYLANSTELLNFATENKLSFTQLKHAQVYYLYHVAEMKRAEIAEITGYAVSTLSRMRNNLYELAEFARQIFEIEEELKVIEKTLIRSYKGSSVPMNYLEDCGEDTPGAEMLYLFKFFTENLKEPLFSKIGTTTRSVDKRLREEIAYYIKHDLPITSVDVCKIVDCGEMPAECYESLMRGILMKKYPNTWHKNDRFFGVDVPTDEFMKLFEKFSEL